ncbi:MAG: DUF433 domain-containing protein [Dehalococcoidia bacterium]
MVRSRDQINTFIALDPTHPGAGDARLVRSGISVWAIIGQLKAMKSDKADVIQVARDYDISEDEVLAALAFYLRHAPLIDARLAANGWDEE